MRAPTAKAFLELDGRPMLEHSLAVFDAHPRVDDIILLVPAPLLEEASRITARYRKVTGVVPGGRRRQDTVALGLERIAAGGAGDLVLIHDAARPLVDPDLITRVVEAAARTGAAVPGLRPADTVREEGGKDGARRAGRTLERDRLVLTQTPQGFELETLRVASHAARGVEVTDDAMMVERLGRPVEIVAGSPRNLKITSPEDLVLAAALLRLERGGSS